MVESDYRPFQWVKKLLLICIMLPIIGIGIVGISAGLEWCAITFKQRAEKAVRDENYDWARIYFELSIHAYPFFMSSEAENKEVYTYIFYGHLELGAMNYDKARELYREAASLAANRNMRIAEAHALAGLGHTALCGAGRMDWAAVEFSLAAFKFGSHRGGEDLAAYMSIAGELNMHLHKYKDAEFELGIARDANRERGDLRGEVDAIQSIGILDLSRSHYDQALENFELARQLASSANYSEGMEHADWGINVARMGQNGSLDEIALSDKIARLPEQMECVNPNPYRGNNP